MEIPFPGKRKQAFLWRLADDHPRQRYFLLDESRVPEEKLRESEGIAALLLRLERARNPEDMRGLIGDLLAQLQAPEYLHLRRFFVVWLERVVFKRSGITNEVQEFQDVQEVNVMLAERVAQWEEEFKRQGREEGMQQGMQQGRADASRDFARRLLNDGMSPERVAELSGLALDAVFKLAAPPLQ
ncbi:MAG: hypothetical protein LBR31_03580 [Desulfovibrio sp.]|jgi:predicted transposase/invertase (TIGR01784 family)|nr:hypothetical protein [Desulfovibrio sp.]